MRATEDCVYKGQIYLKGAEMPEGWKPPVKPTRVHSGTTIHGPAGVVTRPTGAAERPKPNDDEIVETLKSIDDELNEDEDEDEDKE